MKKIFAAVIFFLGMASSYADGLGISSKVYASRFNSWAEEFKSPMRLRSEGAKVTKGPKATTVQLKLDQFTSILLNYDADPTKLAGVTLFRELGGDSSQALDAMTSMWLASMSAFEKPKLAKVPDVTMKACGDALKKPGSGFNEKVLDRTISCMVIKGVMILSIY